MLKSNFINRKEIFNKKENFILGSGSTIKTKLQQGWQGRITSPSRCSTKSTERYKNYFDIFYLTRNQLKISNDIHIIPSVESISIGSFGKKCRSSNIDLALIKRFLFVEHHQDPIVRRNNLINLGCSYPTDKSAIPRIVDRGTKCCYSSETEQEKLSLGQIANISQNRQQV